MRDPTKDVEQGADAPRPLDQFGQEGARRSAMEQTDWHEQDEERFPPSCMEALDAAVMAGKRHHWCWLRRRARLGVLRQLIPAGSALH